MEKQLYRITFLNQGKVYELYAEHVGHGHLGGFIEITRPHGLQQAYGMPRPSSFVPAISLLRIAATCSG